MANPIASADLQRLLASDDPHALIDVRERVEYNTAHIPRATTVPRRLIEWRLLGTRDLPMSGIVQVGAVCAR